MIFTIMPPEDVWSEPTRRSEADAGDWVSLPGRRMVCLRRGPDGYRVERLVSLEPRDYLVPALQPGALWLDHRGQG